MNKAHASSNDHGRSGSELSGPTIVSEPISRDARPGIAAVGLGAMGFVLRLGYFAVSPLVLIILALRLPVTGAIVNLVIFLVVLFLRDRLPGVGTQRLFRRMARLELYYERHPPKPFLYYVFFPLFAPYWLIYGPARRELFHYRKMSTGTMIVFVVVKVVDYWQSWYPVIPFARFARIAVASLFLELVVFAMIGLPLATSVVTYKRAGAQKRLAGLFLVASASLGLGLLGKSLVRRDEVRLDVAIRRDLRMEYRPDEAAAVVRRALEAAAATIAEPTHVPTGSRLEPLRGKARDAARAELRALFRPDEVPSFSVFMVRTRDDIPALVLFAPRQGTKAPFWRALVLAPNGSHEIVADAARFPDGAIH